jgi:hypothetical protein
MRGELVVGVGGERRGDSDSLKDARKRRYKIDQKIPKRRDAAIRDSLNLSNSSPSARAVAVWPASIAPERVRFLPRFPQLPTRPR